MNHRKRGQFSLEFLITVAIGMTFLLALVGVFFYQTKQTQEDRDIALINEIGEDLTQGAETIYYAGDYSQKTLTHNLPNMIYNVSMQGRELVFYITLKGRQSEMVFYSDVPVSGFFNITDGYNAQDISHIYIFKGGNGTVICTNLGCE